MKVPAANMALMLIVLTLTACYPQAEPDETWLKPGDLIGEMQVVKSEFKNVDLSIFNYCEPYLGSQPVTLTFECQVPQSYLLFVGYGEIANSIAELNKKWESKTWTLYLDGNPVDLSAFGTLDVDLGKKIRVWNVALENPSLGAHVLRYEARDEQSSASVTDLTWRFTVVDQMVLSSSTPSPEPRPTPSAEPESVAPLSSVVKFGMHPYRSESAGFNFMFYVPKRYESNQQQSLPLILYLHGTALRGDDINKLRIGEFTAILQYEPDLPFLVVAPQLPANNENRSWSMNDIPERLFQLLDEIQETYSVDPKRIYLTGSSLGGGGTWEIGLRYPKYFAALVPVMGFYGYPFNIPENICDLKDVPIWAFHGEDDLTVPLEAEQGLVDGLRACGGNVKFTVYPGAGHDVDIQVYKTPELFEWMLAQSLD